VELEYKPDFEEARRRWEALWARELIDRPVTKIIVPRDSARPVDPPGYLMEVAQGIDAALDAFETYAEETLFLGDAIPAFQPSAGPDQFAAFLGAEIKYAQTERTSWVVPSVESWEHVLPLAVREDNPTWRMVQDAVRRIASRGEGKYLVGMLDLHTGLDALAAMRGPERLCLDLYDGPAAIGDALADVRPAFPAVYERVLDLGRMADRGTVRACYSPGRFNIIACDFASMIGPDMFRKFVLPVVEEEAAYLDHSMFHVDGPGVLVHLDDILALRDIDVINWVPSPPTKPVTDWLDVFRRVQAAGKIMQILDADADGVKTLVKELRPERLYFERVQVACEKEARDLLSWLEANT